MLAIAFCVIAKFVSMCINVVSIVQVTFKKLAIDEVYFPFSSYYTTCQIWDSLEFCFTLLLRYTFSACLDENHAMGVPSQKGILQLVCHFFWTISCISKRLNLMNIMWVCNFVVPKMNSKDLIGEFKLEKFCKSISISTQERHLYTIYCHLKDLHLIGVVPLHYVDIIQFFWKFIILGQGHRMSNIINYTWERKLEVSLKQY